jgi:hypothetical protein
MMQVIYRVIYSDVALSKNGMKVMQYSTSFLPVCRSDQTTGPTTGGRGRKSFEAWETLNLMSFLFFS